jgi:hypothetical protein
MGAMALELRPNCEFCDKDLPADALDARICSYECTFCADCVEGKLFNVCPNCGGGFTPRPIRPRTEWRAGLSLAKRPASAKRVALSHDLESITALSLRLRDVPPEQR